MKQDNSSTLLAAKLIIEAAEICNERQSVILSGVTIHCPKPELTASARLVLQAHEAGEGLDKALESFTALLL